MAIHRSMMQLNSYGYFTRHSTCYFLCVICIDLLYKDHFNVELFMSSDIKPFPLST
jgi:hypothetical protein